jgi:hypothetical protein
MLWLALRSAGALEMMNALGYGLCVCCHRCGRPGKAGLQQRESGLDCM